MTKNKTPFPVRDKGAAKAIARLAMPPPGNAAESLITAHAKPSRADADVNADADADVNVGADVRTLTGAPGERQRN
jgi:hypothetical protein